MLVHDCRMTSPNDAIIGYALTAPLPAALVDRGARGELHRQRRDRQALG